MTIKFPLKFNMKQTILRRKDEKNMVDKTLLHFSSHDCVLDMKTYLADLLRT